MDRLTTALCNLPQGEDARVYKYNGRTAWITRREWEKMASTPGLGDWIGAASILHEDGSNEATEYLLRPGEGPAYVWTRLCTG